MEMEVPWGQETLQVRSHCSECQNLASLPFENLCKQIQGQNLALNFSDSATSPRWQKPKNKVVFPSLFCSW